MMETAPYLRPEVYRPQVVSSVIEVTGRRGWLALSPLQSDKRLLEVHPEAILNWHQQPESLGDSGQD